MSDEDDLSTMGDETSPEPSPHGAPYGDNGPQRPRNRAMAAALAVAAVLVVGTVGVTGYVLFGGSPATSSAEADGAAEVIVGTGSATVSTSPTSSEALRTADRDPFAGGQAVSTGSTSGSGSAAAVTVTVTADPPIYVGLYGFINGKADFWVDATEYTAAVGDTFGSDFTYTAQTDQGCARVTHDGTTETICAGEVRAFD